MRGQLQGTALWRGCSQAPPLGPRSPQVIELLAAGTLATQTLVLAASLLQQPESQASAAAAAPVGPAASATAAAATALRPRGWLGALRQLLPTDGTEARALAVLVLTRFVALPLVTISALQALVAGEDSCKCVARTGGAQMPVCVCLWGG